MFEQGTEMGQTGVCDDKWLSKSNREKSWTFEENAW